MGRGREALGGEFGVDVNAALPLAQLGEDFLFHGLGGGELFNGDQVGAELVGDELAAEEVGAGGDEDVGRDAAMAPGRGAPMPETLQVEQRALEFAADDVQIDPEFAALIPPLSRDELAQLERSLLEEGCCDPLLLWRGKLIDGHNRLALCRKHRLPFRMEERCEVIPSGGAILQDCVWRPRSKNAVRCSPGHSSTAYSKGADHDEAG